jgi:hypothetical protein
MLHCIFIFSQSDDVPMGLKHIAVIKINIVFVIMNSYVDCVKIINNNSNN